jgi:hypothetical protein
MDAICCIFISIYQPDSRFGGIIRIRWWSVGPAHSTCAGRSQGRCIHALLFHPSGNASAAGKGDLKRSPEGGIIECTDILAVTRMRLVRTIAGTFIGSYSTRMREEKRPRWGVRTSNPRKDRLPILGGFDSHSLPPTASLAASRSIQSKRSTRDWVPPLLGDDKVAGWRPWGLLVLRAGHERRVVSFIGAVQDITERIEHQEREHLLVREINHRANNARHRGRDRSPDGDQAALTFPCGGCRFDLALAHNSVKLDTCKETLPDAASCEGR